MTRPPPAWPWATTALVVTCLALAAVPGTAAALEYRPGTTAPEPWRLATAQLLHWSRAMLVADLLLLAVAGSIAELRSRRLAWYAMLLGAGATATALLALGGPERYRGSSGIGTALVVAVGLELIRRPGGRAARPLAVSGLLVLAAKLLIDLGWSGPSWAATTLPGGVRVAWEVHLAGALAGVVAWLAARRGLSVAGTEGGDPPASRVPPTEQPRSPV